jgi:HEAT repeat protein
MKTIVAAASLLIFASSALAQSSRNLTPVQIEIEKQEQRLTSSEAEERRDAVMRLGVMRLAAASRAALPALKDPAPSVRVAAAKSILLIGPEESVSALLPLLGDKDEFVRREVAYALGLTRNRSATSALTERLLKDKEDGVRGAAAVALGQIADEAAVVPLVEALKRGRNDFVLRAAAASLGQIGSRAGTPALIATLANERLPSDVRREAARSLGLIGDPSAAPALRAASTAADPYLSEAASQALKKLK